QGFSDLLNDDGGKPLRRFVEQDHLRAGTQDTPNGEHLLLAARKLRSLTGKPFAQVGKHLKDFFKRKPPGFTWGGSIKFSSTERLAKMPRSSGTYPRPSRAIARE